MTVDSIPASPTHRQATVHWAEAGMHWTLLIMGAVILMLSLLMRVEGPTSVFLPGASFPMPETCSSRMLFGIDCPGCGMTRAFISISHGRLADAWHFNPASFLLYLVIIGQVPWQTLQLFRIRRGQRPIESMWVYLLPSLAILAMLGQWIAKLLFVM